MGTAKERPTLESRILRVVRKVEQAAHEDLLKKLRRQEVDEASDTGTGFTALKMKYLPKSLATLLEAGKIGRTELQAADQIALAVFSIHSGGKPSQMVFERVDRSDYSGRDWPAHVAKAVGNYQSWMNHWSREWKRTRNPMSSVVWDAVIMETSLQTIALNIGRHYYKAQDAVAGGLKHYAAWTGLVSGAQATAWLQAGTDVFNRGPPPLKIKR